MIRLRPDFSSHPPRKLVAHLILLAWLSCQLTALSDVLDRPPLTSAQLDFFEQRIRPILANECYECHGARKQQRGLRLDSREGLLKGGNSGPALVPGDANKSPLL